MRTTRSLYLLLLFGIGAMLLALIIVGLLGR